MSKSKYINNLDDIKLTKEFIFLNPYKFIVIFIYLIIFLIIGISSILAFTKKQESIDVQGRLQISNKLQDIQVLVEGIIDEIYVQDGEYVEKGQAIFSLRSDKLELKKIDINKKLEKAKEQMDYLTKLESCINRKVNNFENNEKEGYFYAQVEKYLSQIRSIESGVSSSEVDSLVSQKNYLNELLNAMKNDTSLSTDHVHYTQLELYKIKIGDYDKKIDRLQELVNNEIDSILAEQYKQQFDALVVEKDSFVEKNILEVQSQINTLNSKIEQAQNIVVKNREKVEIEIEKLKNSSLAEVKEKEQQLQNSISEYEASITSINLDLNSYSIQATGSGYVNYKGKIQKDMVLSAGSVVGILTSTKNERENFEVILNVPSNGIGFIKVDQNIKLTVDGLDRKDYGFINGTVKKVYESPIQIDNSIYYQVVASIDIKEKDSIYKEVFTLKDSMSVQANIITKETSWLTYILEKMNLFKDSKEKKKNIT